MQAGRSGAPTVSVTTPVDEMVDALNAYRPEVIAGYASMMGVLAEEQLQGRLAISPRVVLTTSEALTDDAAARIEAAWTKPVEGLLLDRGGRDRLRLARPCRAARVRGRHRRGRRRREPAGAGRDARAARCCSRTSCRPPSRSSATSSLTPSSSRTEWTGAVGRIDRIARIDGRSDDVLRLPARRRRRGRRPSVPSAGAVREAAGGSAVPGRPQRRRPARAHRRPRLRQRDLPQHVRSVVEAALARAGAHCAVEVEVVPAIAREGGHAAKVKLVVSEASRPT